MPLEILRSARKPAARSRAAGQDRREEDCRAVKAVKAARAPWAARQMYLNFADTRRDTAQFWSEQAYQRLRRIKAAVDPGDLIRSNHPVPPAA